MPIYTYECQSCTATLERRQSFHEAPLSTHDECGGSLRRVIHPAGIVFKGSGFYNTDYKNGTSSNRSSTDAKAESKDSTAGDSSPAASASTADTTSSNGAASADTAAKSEPAKAGTP